MKYRMTAATAAVLLGVTGCGSAPPGTSEHSQRVAQIAAKNLQAAIKAHQLKVSPTAEVYETDSIGIQDGSRIGVFPASSKVTRDASGLTVIDADSGQTFRYSAHATVQTERGTGRVYVERGSAIPKWARESNARALETQARSE